jgi:hypothetical protein
MKPSKSVILLSILTGVLALVQAGVGLFYQAGGAPFPFTTLHGQAVQMNGQGMYAMDTYFKAPIFRGTDAITLLICIPLLVIALLLYRRGSLRGNLLLVGALGFFLYNSASVALGVAYNNLFLLYVAFFSASLFAFILAFTAIDRQDLADRLSASRLPHRGMAILMFVSGAALLAAWLGDILAALFAGTVPAIASYTTEVTYVFDLGIIAPLSALTGILLLRHAPIGYLLSALMLIILAIVGLMVTSQSVFQMLAGITLTPGQFIGKAGSFMVLAVIAAWMAARLFQGVRE